MGMPQKSTRTKTRRRTRYVSGLRYSPVPESSCPSGISIKSQPTYVRRSTSNSTRARKLLKSFLALGNGIVSSAPNGLKASIALSHIGREALIEEGEQTSDSSIALYKTRFTMIYRIKALKDEPYSQKEAEAAVGLRTDNGFRRETKRNSQDVEVEMQDTGMLEDDPEP